MKLPKELKEKQELSTKGQDRECSVIKCRKQAARSLSENKWKKYAEGSGLNYKENRLKKIYLCKKHYKEIKKERQKDKDFYQKKGFLEDSYSSSGRR
ncbi:MAG: hypothetical protein EU550_02920 [Promethearchaeota archaeon]|nr:MAG: hypothetical protein EU550_02920 [Candidatus Lokiarchaeota archaeon]